jgi:hypothetical protein
MDKRGSELKVGDTIKTWFNGGQAQIKRLTPYTGSLIDAVGHGTQVAAFFGCSTEMTLCHNDWHELVEASA